MASTPNHFGVLAEPIPETRSNTTETSSPRASANVGRCLAVLEEMEMDERNRKQVEATLPDLLTRFPKVNPVDACRKYRDKVAGMTEPVKCHDKYLAGHFERLAKEVADERPNPLGAGTAFFGQEKKSDLKPLSWYAEKFGGAMSEMEIGLFLSTCGSHDAAMQVLVNAVRDTPKAEERKVA